MQSSCSPLINPPKTNEILAISDRILVMCKGTVVDETVAGEATQEGVLEKGLMGSGREIG